MNEQAKKYTMTTREFAERMQVSMPTAYDMTNIEGFPVIRVGRKKLIPIEAFEVWLKENASKAVR